ncbi:MAG TPA: hypothetical protein VFX92_13455 [Candidatus Krumholzibacteria bacterium]|nr:hypothetical protein [Candidatus Krumholzibacteria bacterium]
MQCSRLTTTALAVLIALPAVARAQSSPAPDDSAAAQQLVPRLVNLSSLATIMNLGRGSVRIIAVIAPSAPGAEDGLDVLASVFENIPGKRLRAYVLLTRATDADTHVRALSLAARLRDRRVVYLWDPDGIGASLTAPLTGTPAPPGAGVYCLYDTDATFGPAAPEPALWMEAGSDPAGPPLEARALEERAAAMVRTVEREAAKPASGSR